MSKYIGMNTISADIIAERPELLQEYTTYLIPYTDRKDLTAMEKVCIGNYQDVHFWNTQKKRWSFFVPNNWEGKPWCYVINSCCRNFEFYKLLSAEEKELVGFNIQNIDSAIQKSKTDKDYTLYRGVNNIDWLKNSEVGESYIDYGFGSFTLDINKALEYTNVKNPIIFQLELEKGANALYIDRAENEMLRPRNSPYRIIKQDKIYLIDEDIEVTVYKIRVKEDESYVV
ncbi:hypothetical protein MmiHf6_05360 [Methanimicrococcus hongohii]|uniref:ADP ribosyltransferase domain-containing protein n=1 Tax=Methanimicrococcus hongohii TaxID=3028295 RepID=A0AA96UYY4_9EURY|nr:ADP-ribosyltransferase [Methanimicrococcus sp. Hf6]WNY23231.1 hypothetical protein MmiHf6_05360 [Methanimicrococcus sp. Hf6]